MGMCHWMGSHFHDWIDYNAVAFSITRMGWYIFGIFQVRKFWKVGSLVIKNIDYLRYKNESKVRVRRPVLQMCQFILG